MTQSMVVKCKNCQSVLLESDEIGFADEERQRIQPCPNCGQIGLHVEAMVSETGIKLYDSVGIKAKRPGLKKPLYEAKLGASQSTATGEWNQVTQIVDRTNTTHDVPWYTKRVETKDGEVLRDVSHPLSEHTGRGSAKKKAEE